MPVLPIDDHGVEQAVQALRSGEPIIIPTPSPLAYTVVGTHGATVNIAKKRPGNQPVGVSVSDLDVIAPYLDVAGGVLPLAQWLCESELVSLLAPVVPDAPGWLAPAMADGMVFFTSSRWVPELGEIIATFQHLYMSSANVTGGQSATTAAEAAGAFDPDLIVLDGDARRDPSVPHGSTTMVRLSRDGDLTVVRPGINNLAYGTDLTAYGEDLRRRWQATNGSGRHA